ncbi:hypothetical protein CBS9595_002908 [Malassezia furfur]|nr:hypothetical protein CBS9595_002908 [Malassezia furfur]
MVHADAAGLPSYIASKDDFYEHVETQIAGILEGQRNWVTNLANVSAVLYHAMNAFSAWHDKHVNWAGFYLLSPLFPGGDRADVQGPTLWLGPFCGMPACQSIASVPGKGVCADGSAVLPPTTVSGHIACDSQSQSEIVVPLVVPRAHFSGRTLEALHGRGTPELVRAWSGRGDGDDVIVGVLDLDCVAPNGFDDTDARALERIVRRIRDACDWDV